MKTFSVTLIALVTIFGPLQLTRAATSFRSPNGAFEVSFVDATPMVSSIMFVRATMFAFQGGGPVALWSQTTDGMAGAIDDVIVANDGSYCIYGWSILKKSGIVHIPTYTPKLPASANPPINFKFPTRFASEGGALYEIDSYKDQSIVRSWNRDEDRWLAMFIHTEQIIEPTPELIAQWNKATRESILDRISRAKDQTIRRKFESAYPKVASAAARLLNRAVTRDPGEIDYAFLAVHGEPADRSLLERLLNGDHSLPLAPFTDDRPRAISTPPESPASSNSLLPFKKTRARSVSISFPKIIHNKTGSPRTSNPSSNKSSSTPAINSTSPTKSASPSARFRPAATSSNRSGTNAPRSTIAPNLAPAITKARGPLLSKSRPAARFRICKSTAISAPKAAKAITHPTNLPCANGRNPTASPS